MSGGKWKFYGVNESVGIRCANIALSANDVHFQISIGSTFIRFKSKRWHAAPALRHQSFLEGFAYPSFLPTAVLAPNFYIEWSPLNQQSVRRNRVLYYFLWINNIISRGKGGLDFVKYGLVIELKSLNVDVQLSLRFCAWWCYFHCFVKF